MKVATNAMFIKMSAKSGIKKFGEKAVADILREYIQIYKGTMEWEASFNSHLSRYIIFQGQKESDRIC